MLCNVYIHFLSYLPLILLLFSLDEARLLQNSMASISVSSASSSFSKDNTMKLDLESVSSLATTINQHIDTLLANNKAWMSLKFKCTSKLDIQKQPTFEFSEYSIVSNLYWGIEAVDAATQAQGQEERTSRLQNSEKMLQVPASLHEQGFTSGIPNEYLICCSYFYLSVVRKLQSDDWQAALHFLQALLVSPRLVHDEFAPELCQSLMHLYIRHKRQERPASRLSKSAAVRDLDEDQANEIMGWMAKEYKAWLLYYQIMSNGEHDPKHLASIDNALPDDKSKDNMEPVFRSASGKSQGSNLRGNQGGLPFSLKIRNKNADEQQAEVDDQNLQAPCYNQCAEITACSPQNSTHLIHREGRRLAVLNLLSRTLSSSFNDIDVSATRPIDNKSHVPVHGKRKKDAAQRKLELQDWRQSSLKEFPPPRSHQFHQLNRTRSTASDTGKKRTTFGDTLHQVQKYPEETSHIEQAQILEKLISKLCFSETLGNLEEDYTVEISTVYKLLNNRRGLKYSLLKDIILDQLLMAISTSKKEQVIRASVTILSTIVSGNKTIIEDIKRKGLQLYDLATALRRNVHEASILIYLINPPPEEIKTLEILPCLVEVVCTSNSYKDAITSIRLTPRAASLMIIEILVTAFDCTTNNMHLSTISSPRVLSGLLDVPGNNDLEEFISLAAILVRCMRFDAQCRKFICEFAPVTELFSLLRSNQKRATSTALEFFHELLRMPRSSAIKLLQEIRKDGSINSMSALLLLIQNSQPEHRLLAANLLLQLDMLEEASSKLMYREEAVKALLESLISEENSAKQALSAFILSNIGGTYSWTGEPYTVAWLAKRAGLTSLHHKNMIKNYDFSDESLQDAGIDTWCGKLARRIIKFGTPVFNDLVKGLDSKSKRISRDCLTAIAWIGCEVAKSSDELRSSACEILLNKMEQYVHPGFELEERLLACLCIYNYTLGRGMKKLMHFSEGVRESLRRLANVTWMAEELLRVADYFQPNKWRISCVHTQILEVGQGHNGAVTALIYYRGQLCSGYADGSIKVWDIKGQTATLVQGMKNHNKAVTCFALLEQGNCLLSGSADKSIKIWQMVQRKLECIEIIATKESIQSIDTFGQLIFTISRGHKMKVFDASRNAKDIFKNKSVKAMKVVQGKVYAGCVDSSIQELAIQNSRQQEIRAPAKKWLMQNKPVNTLAVYKDWLYGGSVVVEGSTIKDWRRNIKPQVSVMSEKGANVLAMEVVEDFIYLNTAASRSSLQIWLRGTLHKVGRLSAGSKITSLLCANDMILCGTEAGLIKGWIPL